MMKQGEAVFQAVSKTFDTNEAVPETGAWTDAQKEKVYTELFTMFKSGQWAKNSGGQDDAAVLKYIPGLVNNWVRKDPRLNGGAKYVAKNPGSRQGSGDEMVKNMKLLLSTIEDPDQRAEVENAIKLRLEQLKPKTVIDVAKIPENLRHLVKTA